MNYELFVKIFTTIHMKNKNIKKEWWETTFNEKYTTTYMDATPSELTIKQVDFLHKNLKLKKGTKILDLACGFGRHSISLKAKGKLLIDLNNSIRTILSI